MLHAVVFKGFATTLSLIAAIGAQNTFLLRQGLMKQHVLLVVLTCLICDIAMMALGVFAVDSIVTNPTLENILTLGGAIFLFTYGAYSFKSAYNGNSRISIEQQNTAPKTAIQILAMALAVTLLNPHAYLDVIVVLGGICVPLDLNEKQMFFIGATIGSIIWFFSIGYGARFLIPVFKSKHAWRVFDTLTGLIMWSIATSLIYAVSKSL
jgi:L-lysine exporter family protein LysE/ArgO